MKLHNILFLGLLSGSLAAAYPVYPTYSPLYTQPPVYYTPPVYFPPVNVYTPPVVVAPTSYHSADYYCYDYDCYECNAKAAGKTLATIGVLGLSLLALNAIFNS